jgi:hypothetical protein
MNDVSSKIYLKKEYLFSIIDNGIEAKKVDVTLDTLVAEVDSSAVE